MRKNIDKENSTQDKLLGQRRNSKDITGQKKKNFFLTSKDIEGEESAGFRLFYNESQC